jgi:hypothetical protein
MFRLGRRVMTAGDGGVDEVYVHMPVAGVAVGRGFAELLGRKAAGGAGCCGLVPVF